jgi:hypothetical protein
MAKFKKSKIALLVAISAAEHLLSGFDFSDIIKELASNPGPKTLSAIAADPTLVGSSLDTMKDKKKS